MSAFEFAHTNISLSRSISSYGKVQGIVSALIRGRKAFMNFKTKGLILDVGCGPNSNSRNINLDYHWRPGVDICCDITRGLPLSDDYVAGIYTEHCIEHIPFDRALFVFREFYRVMKSGTNARIVVPDLEIYVNKYDLFRKTGELEMPYGIDDAGKDSIIYSPAVSVNRIFREHGHEFIYDFTTMAAMLDKVGFIEVNKARFGEGANPLLILDTPGRAIESLYVEARKP
jgi:predicted SAM-dependent methyltransferase